MNTLPRMAYVEQEFPRPKVDDVTASVQMALQNAKASCPDLSGKKIAVTVGSRGITNLTQIVKAAVDGLKQLGAEPFIIPAMGSHGGGTADGQRHILEEYGITEATMGVPVQSSLDTIIVGKTEQGFPVHFDPYAYQADYALILNRIKPHTDFKGEVESGLQKMMTVGIGKISGAQTLHNNSSEYTFDTLIRSIAKVVLSTGKILGGLAIIENAYHETAEIEFIPAQDIPSREPELLQRARSYMPSLPVDAADVLVLDYIGKDISGVGMDPNIIGRYYRINSHWQEKPDITRIVLMDLSEKTNGNASGIGLADFCSTRAVDKMDKHSTYLNSITSRNVVCANIPPNYDDDRALLEYTFQSLGSRPLDDIRMLHIRDTLNLTRIEASESMLPDLEKHPNVKHISDAHDLRFDGKQQLVPLEA